MVYNGAGYWQKIKAPQDRSDGAEQALGEPPSPGCNPHRTAAQPARRETGGGEGGERDEAQRPIKK